MNSVRNAVAAAGIVAAGVVLGGLGAAAAQTTTPTTTPTQPPVTGSPGTTSDDRLCDKNGNGIPDSQESGSATADDTSASV